MLRWGKHAVISLLVCPKINIRYFHFDSTVPTLQHSFLFISILWCTFCIDGTVLHILYQIYILLLVVFASQMSQKITLVFWAIRAVRTGKRQIPRVSANVSNEVASLWGPVRTVGTEVHSWVHHHTHTAWCNVTLQWAHPFLPSSCVYWHTFC